MIDPRVASGTRDILPALAIQRDRIVTQFKQTFERYGFVPIDTPVLERREVLYAKGGEEVQRQVFEVASRGQALKDSELALRFDLTVPLARFMAKHVDEFVWDLVHGTFSCDISLPHIPKRFETISVCSKGSQDAFQAGSRGTGALAEAHQWP